MATLTLTTTLWNAEGMRPLQIAGLQHCSKEGKEERKKGKGDALRQGAGRKTEEGKRGTEKNRNGKWNSMHIFLPSDTGYKKYVQNK